MQLIKTPSPSAAQKENIYRLWNSEYPERLNYTSLSQLDQYLDALENKQHWFLMRGEELAGWCLCFEREQERWFAIILDRHMQGKGYGTQLLDSLKASFPALSGWVIDHERDKKQDGTAYPSPLPFYLAQGFRVNASIRLETETISAVKIEWKKRN